MAITKRQAWLLPLAFLLGFVCAWGMILVDRQMLIDEQAELRWELRQTKLKLRVFDAADEFGSSWQEMVIWNEKAVIPSPKEVPSGQVAK